MSRKQILALTIFVAGVSSEASVCHRLFSSNWLAEAVVPLESVKHGQDFANSENATHVLLTSKISPEKFPYSAAQRPAKTMSAIRLLSMVQNVPEIQGLQITKVIIGSPDKAAGNGLVRLGYLPNGRPVVVKTLMTSTNEMDRTNEARGTMLLSLVGIGARFHGVVREGSSYHVVTDLIVGDTYTPRNSSAKILNQMLEIVNRLSAIGIQTLHPREAFFQAMRTKNDEILIIDPDGYYNSFLAAHQELSSKRHTTGIPWYKILYRAVLRADAQTMQAFFDKLRESNMPLYQAVLNETKIAVFMNGAEVSYPVIELLRSLD